MQKMFSLIIVLSFFTASCAVQPINNLSFQNKPVFVTEPQTKDYKELGHAAANASGFIWNSCEKIAENGIDILLRNAQNMGGNAVIRLQISECTTQYGWFFYIFFPVLAPGCELSMFKVLRLSDQSNINEKYQCPTSPHKTKDWRLVCRVGIAYLTDF